MTIGHHHLAACVAAAMILYATEASAQRGRDVELSGGYVFVRDPRTDLAFPRGWTVGAAYPIGPVSAVVRVDRSAATLPLVVGDASLTQLAVVAGPRAGVQIGRLRQSAEVLIGGVDAQGILFGDRQGERRLVIQPGVCVDYELTDSVAVRLAIGDRVVHTGLSWSHQLRAASEVVYSRR